MASQWTFEISADDGTISFQIVGPGGEHRYPARQINLEPEDAEKIGIALIVESGKAREGKAKKPKIRSA